MLFTIVVGSAIVISHFLRNHLILVYVQVFSITWISAVIQWSIGSIDQSGMVMMWCFLGPLTALICLSLRQSLVWMGVFLVIVAISAAFEPMLMGVRHAVSDNTRVLFYIMNVGFASTIVFAASAWFVQRIQKERKRSDEILLNILPSEIALELKQQGFSNAKQYNETTIMFTDFVAFASYAENLSARDLVRELDQCFSAFDEILSRYSIEKIKTVGDAYLAVSGLPIAAPLHAQNMVRAAREIRDYMLLRVDKNPGSFEIRIGIHTGTVVAGIVGVKKFAYDIWGDSVNVAARMEQNSQPGKINISQTTHDIVKNEFSCHYRGEIEAKNKGLMKMYFVD